MKTTKRTVICQRILVSFMAVVLSVNGGLGETAYGEKIHLILACDTTAEAGLGADIVADSTIVPRVFLENVPQSQLTTTLIKGDALSKQAILGAIRALPLVRRTDSIVFFYTGHGAYDKDKQEHFYSLPRKQQLSRSEVERALVARDPRAAVLITDCCAAYSKFNGPVDRPKSMVQKAVRISPLFKSLFLGRSGVFSITSSKPGEVSITRGDGKGSLFTYHFVEFLKSNSNRPLAWDSALLKVKSTVDKDFKVLTKHKGIDTSDPRDGNSDQFTQTVHAFMLTPRLGMRIKQANGQLMISEIVALSPAAQAKTAAGNNVDLDSGDILLEVNGRPVRTEREYSNAVDNSAGLMRFKVRDSASKQVFDLQTTLNE